MVDPIDSAGYVQRTFSVPVKLDWEDDGKEYACVVIMGNYKKSSTTVLTVYRKLYKLFVHEINCFVFWEF